MIHTGDCVDVMAAMDAESVDAICTDPPYGLGFMGKHWDVVRTAKRHKSALLPAGGEAAFEWNPNPFQARCTAWGAEALRVTKPGGYLLAFGGTRTHHRLVCGLEDAGWIIRDELTWIYASGFPKGRANLKPAHEPIVLARKPGPLRELAIDECRIGFPGDKIEGGTKGTTAIHGGGITVRAPVDQTTGRWPSNILLSSPELFDVANPDVVGSGAVIGIEGQMRIVTRPRNKGWVNSSPGDGVEAIDTYGDTGGYSRFFIVPKSDRRDREPVLRGQLPDRESLIYSEKEQGPLPQQTPSRPSSRENGHPTVKPVDLMRHLVRLVTPPGGVVLDPFLGSGSTAIACEMEGFGWIGIEKEPEYVAIAEARLNGTQRGMGLSA